MENNQNSPDIKACRSLLSSAHQLIKQAKETSPKTFQDLIELKEICSLIDEIRSIGSDNYQKIERRVGREINSGFQSEYDGKKNYNADLNDQEYPVKIQKERYENWLTSQWLSESKVQLMAERMITKWSKRPTIALFICVEESELSKLENTLNSLNEQLYKDWSLTVVSTVSRESAQLDTNLVSSWIQVNDLLSGLNNAVSGNSSDWITLIRAGDRIAWHGLFSIADYDNLHGDAWGLIYTDEDYIDQDNERYSPLFKPDINLDYLRSYPYIGRFCLLRKNLLLAIGGYQRVSACCHEDIVLRTIELYGEGIIGHISDVLYHRLSISDDVLDEINGEEWREVVTSHITRCGIDAKVTDGYLAKTNRVVYPIQGEPLVTVIIPTKNNADLIEPCVSSLFEITEYKNFEVIIVDNGSDVEDVFCYYEEWQQRYTDRVKVLSYDKPFNFSEMNNYAASHARGDYLVLLNNDTEIINGTWMERMLQHAQRPEVGAVGARLLYPGGQIQHAGVVLGMADSASHPGTGMDFHSPGYMGRLQVDQNFSAVTAACIMTPRKVYEEASGLDQETFKVLFNDVDYCLRLKAEGYKIVWTPYATLAHKESCSLKALPDPKKIFDNHAEIHNLFKRWNNIIRNDPAFNPNLSFHRPEYTVSCGLLPSWNNDFPKLPRIYSLPQDYMGCGNYRVLSPLNALEDAGVAEITIGPCQGGVALPTTPTATDISRINPDILFMQSVVSDKHIYWVEQYKRNTNITLITDIDDLKTNLPNKNSSKKFMARDMRSRLRKFLSFCDRVTVSTAPLADAYKEYHDDIIVVPNRIDRKAWGYLKSERNIGPKPRVGWIGAQQHHGDLEIIVDVVKQTYKEVDWIFMGMCLEELKPYIKEEHEFVNFQKYPEKMASLNLDLAVAPLELHAFNEAKSNLRLLEYGMLGWPVVCTDIYPYQNSPAKCVKNTTEEWLEAIRERIYDLDFAAREGDALRSWVQQYWILQDHLDDWAAPLVSNIHNRTFDQHRRIA